jgi:hypothetical protein
VTPRLVEAQSANLRAVQLLAMTDNGADRIRLLVANDGTPFLELIGNTETLVWTAP